jgi:uncharacterized protein YkwD
MRHAIVVLVALALCQAATAENRLIRTECNGGVCRRVTVGSAWEYKVVDLTNAIRRRHGLRPLKVTEKAMKFARGWSGTQARQRRMYHSGAAGWGENVIWNYKSPEAMVEAWYASPGHRRNMLNPNYSEIGVGVVMTNDGQPYGTQVFK